MPNFDTITEALKCLGTENLNEDFPKLESHYIDHVASNLQELEKALANGNLVFFIPTKDAYEQAAKELANEPAADQNLTTVKSGTISFAGTQCMDYSTDSTYKIRLKSKLVSREYLISVLGPKNERFADMIIDRYISAFKTADFCDVVIYKRDSKELTSNKTILTFYLAKRSRIDSLIKQCNVYTDTEKKTASENVKEQALILQNPCVKNKLEFIVVKPLSITSKTLTRNKGVDNLTSYNSGVFYSPSKDTHVVFKLDEEINKQLKNDDDKTYSKSSKLTAVAKDTFKLAAGKKIFNSEYTGSDNFRQRYLDDLISVWASDLNDAIDFIYKEPTLRYFIYRIYGVKEIDDYQTYQKIMRDIKRNITTQWEKTINYDE